MRRARCHRPAIRAERNIERGPFSGDHTEAVLHQCFEPRYGYGDLVTTRRHRHGHAAVGAGRRRYACTGSLVGHLDAGVRKIPVARRDVPDRDVQWDGRPWGWHLLRERTRRAEQKRRSGAPMTHIKAFRTLGLREEPRFRTHRGLRRRPEGSPWHVESPDSFAPASTWGQILFLARMTTVEDVCRMPSKQVIRARNKI